MRKRILTTIVGLFLTITAILSMCLCFIDSPAAAASSELAGYFQINYAPAVFSKTEILGSEAFSVTIHGNATCIKEPPVHPTKGQVTGNITAVHLVNGRQVILQATYTVNIEPFPAYQGQSVEMTVTVPLQFPAHGEAGQYSIIAKTIKAEVYKYVWIDVTDMVPASETLGTVNYTPAPVTPTPSHTPSLTASPTPVLPASKLTISLWNANASAWRIDGNGLLLEDANANSSDGSISIHVPTNTKVLDADREPLALIIIAPSNTALTPDKDYQVVSAYDCKPDGASFAPGIELTLAYNPNDLPAGTDEATLKVAHFDKEHPNGELIAGNVTIDKNNNSVTFRTSHFSDFAILAPAQAASDSNSALLPRIIAVGIIVLGLILIMIAVIRKRRMSR